MKKKILMTSKEACEHYHCTAGTLRLWDKQGNIETQRSPGNTRIYIRYAKIEGSEPEHIPSQHQRIAELETDLKKYAGFAQSKNELTKKHGEIMGKLAHEQMARLEKADA